MLSMLYHKKLDPVTWNEAAQRLRKALALAPSFAGLGPDSPPAVEVQQSEPEAEQSAAAAAPASSAAAAAPDDVVPEAAEAVASVAVAEGAAEQQQPARPVNAKVVAAATAAASATAVFLSGKLPLQELPHIIGRSRKQKITLDQECVHESLQVNGVRCALHIVVRWQRPQSGS